LGDECSKRRLARRTPEREAHAGARERVDPVMNRESRPVVD